MNEDEELENEVTEIVEDVAPVEAVAEQKMLPMDRVNDIARRAKMEGYEKAKAEYASEMQSKMNQQSAEQPVAAPQAGDETRKQVVEEISRLAQEHKLKLEEEAEKKRLQEIANNYFEKMEKGSELFEDFDEVMKGFNASKNADVIELAHEFDNLPQIIYELANNRSKAAELRRMAKDDPEDALYELQRLAKSISQNEEAQQQYIPAKPPLTKPKPSHVGTDSGVMSLKDYKNASWLKG